MKAFLAENSVFIKTTAVGLAILVLIFSLPITGRAVSETPYEMPSGNSVSVVNYRTASSGYHDSEYYVSNNSYPVYLINYNWVHDGAVPDGAKHYGTMLFSSGPFDVTTVFGPNDTQNWSAPYDETNGFYSDVFGYTPALDTDFTVLLDTVYCENRSSANAFASEYLTTGGLTESVSTLNYSLPPGNVAFVKLPDNISLFQGVTLRTQMPESNLLYAPNGQLWNSSQRTGFTGSLPSADYDLSQFSLISWAKDGETTVIGQTKNAIYSRGPLLIGNEYMVIVNPIYYGGTANGPYEFMLNGAVQINAVGVKGISVYALDSSIGFTSQGGLTVPTEVIGDPFGGEIDAETGEITWTDPFGGSNAPTEGGNNLIPTGETVFDAVKKIASDFADFLKGPISAIRTVVSAITNFLTEFKSLYVWLPGPVYNLITSAIMVALTIGVVKIFV